MTWNEFADEMRPTLVRIADWIIENLPRIEAAIDQMAAEFAEDVEAWLKNRSTGAVEAPRSDREPNRGHLDDGNDERPADV